MTETDRINEALRLNLLNLPKEPPRVVKLGWDVEEEDSSGDACLDIAVIFDDRTTDREIEKGPIHAIKRAIMDSLDRHEVRLFPYFWFMRESEQPTISEGD